MTENETTSRQRAAEDEPTEFFKSDEDLAKAVMIDHGWNGKERHAYTVKRMLLDAIKRTKRGEAP